MSSPLIYKTNPILRKIAELFIPVDIMYITLYAIFLEMNMPDGVFGLSASNVGREHRICFFFWTVITMITFFLNILLLEQKYEIKSRIIRSFKYIQSIALFMTWLIPNEVHQYLLATKAPEGYSKFLFNAEKFTDLNWIVNNAGGQVINEGGQLLKVADGGIIQACDAMYDYILSNGFTLTFRQSHVTTAAIFGVISFFAIMAVVFKLRKNVKSKGNLFFCVAMIIFFIVTVTIFLIRVNGFTEWFATCVILIIVWFLNNTNAFDKGFVYADEAEEKEKVNA